MASADPSPAVRVMIVEDSLVVRRLLAHIVSRDPRLTLAAAVASAEEALQELPRVRPDVISMDIRLPGMDGLEATRRIMSEQPTPIVVIADSVRDAAFEISMNALRAGALSVVEKPVGIATGGHEQIAETICTQLYIMSQVPVIRRRSTGSYAPPPARTRSETLDALCAEGRTGVMAGRGYFDWGGRAPAELFRARDRKLLALKTAMAGIGRMEGT